MVRKIERVIRGWIWAKYIMCMYGSNHTESPLHN
jgi:hypothetical protein